MRTIVYALAIIVIAAPNALYMSRDREILFQHLIFISTTSLATIIILGLLPYLARKTGAAILSLATALSLPCFAFLAHFGAPLDANVISLAFESNPAELGDLIDARIVLAFAAVLCVFAICFLNVTTGGPLPRIPRARAVWLTSVLFLAFSFMAIQIERGGESDTEQPLPPTGLAAAIRTTYPAGLAIAFVDFYRERKALNQAYANIQDFVFGAKNIDATSPRKIYILAIGETTRADRLGLNGYHRQTTPRLSTLPVTSFQRMYSPETFSRFAVPHIISRKPANSERAFSKEASIITAFKEAKFTTAWISFQAPVGFNESPISIHAYEADRLIFMNPTDYRGHGKKDILAAEIVREVLASTSGDTFIVVHFLGSHFNYNDRYEPVDRLFTPDRPLDDRLSLYNASHREYLSNAYDNTIVMMDRSLAAVIGTLSSLETAQSWLLYVSDHGEALYDDCRQRSGHGEFGYYTQSVAALFWSSARYQSHHPMMVRNMEANRAHPTSTGIIFETISDLGGLDVPGNRPVNSLAKAHPHTASWISQVEKARHATCLEN